MERPVVWFAGVPWDGIPGTDRRLATALSAHMPVLWVDPPLSALTPAARRAGASRRPVPRLSEVDDRITRVSTVALPGLTRTGVRATTAPLLRAQAAWALRRLGRTPQAALATHLEDVLGRWGNGPDVLYGTDDYVAGAGLMGLSADRLRRQERAALRRADVVAAVSPQLADRWTALGARVEVLPNGCQPPGPAPARSPLPDLGDPVVGVVGQLSARIDLAVLETVAAAGFTLLLVGPLDPRWEPGRVAALTGRPNVRYAGAVPAADVPGQLAAVDIGLTPYADSDFNRASFPLKTLEYLAAGLPVVSTALPAARWLSDDLAGSGDARPDQVLVVAAGPAEVVAAVRRLAAGPPVADRCRSFAARHSWDRRAEVLAGLIDSPPARRAVRPVQEVS
jgi:teichuronic acid biosynthesis glycosyltransferase TuaH